MSYGYVSLQSSFYDFRLKDMDVFFSDMKCLDIIKAVLDENGNIKNFPGITEDERWQNKMNVRLFYDVRYEACFISLDDGTFLMKWIVQPNGWYWVDEDGFGFSGDSQITLYCIIDENGNFTKKFELYSIDNTLYADEYAEM
ncbi:MAG: hypothetical protein E7218_04425 [Anaerofustis stercorihominis]|nr:hypothetical protein [Anaerofustis stercorihominis]